MSLVFVRMFCNVFHSTRRFPMEESTTKKRTVAPHDQCTASPPLARSEGLARFLRSPSVPSSSFFYLDLKPLRQTLQAQ